MPWNRINYFTELNNNISIVVILTSSAINKKLEIDKKKLENKLKIDKNLEIKLENYKNLENKLEIYSYFKLEIFEFFVNGRWTQNFTRTIRSWVT